MTEKFEKLLQLRTQEIITNMERNHEKVVVFIKESVEDLRREVKKIQETQNCLSEKYDDLSRKCQTNAEISNQNAAELHITNQRLSKMTDDMDYLHYQIDKLEQYGRRDNLEFHGIAEKPQEDTTTVITSLLAKVVLHIEYKQISISHRLPASKRNKSLPKPIIVKFATRSTRDLVYSKRNCFTEKEVDLSDFPGTRHVYVNENLTSYTRQLFMEVKSAMKKCANPPKYAWTKNGDILMKKDDQSFPEKITSYADLHKLIPYHEKI